MVEVQLGSLTLQPHRQLAFEGHRLPLGRRALDILSVLAEARGELVTKDELLATIWPGVIVEENALQVHVSALRKALGVEASRLVTVRGLGYRLDIGERPSSVPAHSGAQASSPSLAVLPFTNLTGDPARDYLSDGLAAELIATLSRSLGLRIPSYTSSHAYKGKAVDLRQIGRELGVELVLEGEVNAGPNRIRVHAQLIDTTTGFHRWSASFDRHPSDLLALEEELAAAISDALRAHLTPPPRSSTEQLEV